MLWRHPTANVYEIAAAPDGKSLAFTVKLRFESAEDPSFVLYLLGPDGTVQPVDVVRDFGHIATPTFLRAPTEPEGSVKLYWVRGNQDVDPATGRLGGQVMVLASEGPEPVVVPVRFREAPFQLFGYPGAATFSLMLFHTNDVPTRFEVLVNRDRFRNATDASLTLWADNEPRIGTDLSSVAWLSPTEYVIPVAKDDYPEDYSLRLFVFGCEWAGSVDVYSGDGIDWGYAENPWPILPGGDDQVLVLGARDMAAILAREVSEIPWLAMNLETGRITATDAMWSRGPGWWTFVQPDRGPGVPVESSEFPDCSEWDWTYP